MMHHCCRCIFSCHNLPSLQHVEAQFEDAVKRGNAKAVTTACGLLDMLEAGEGVSRSGAIALLVSICTGLLHFALLPWLISNFVVFRFMSLNFFFLCRVDVVPPPLKQLAMCLLGRRQRPSTWHS